MTINERIKEIRKDKKLNQKDFGMQLGLKQNTVSNMETEGYTITEQNLKQICSTYNVNENWLRDGEGDKYTSDKQDIMALLQQKYQLTANEQILVSAVLELSHEERQSLIAIVRQMSAKLQKAEAIQEAESAAQVNVTVTEDEAKFLDAYRKKKRQEADISALSMTGT